MIWNNSKMATIYFDETPSSENYPCTVKLIHTEILVEYEGEKGIVQYRGVNDGSNHFKLSAPHVQGRATLHRFSDDDRLEGSWVEGGIRGMWIIDLDEEVN